MGVFRGVFRWEGCSGGGGGGRSGGGGGGAFRGGLKWESKGANVGGGGGGGSLRLFSSSPFFKIPSFTYVLRVITAKCVMLRCKYEAQICSQLSISSPRQILLHYDNVK